MHQVLVLRPIYVSEKVGVNKKRRNSKMIFPEKIMEYIRAKELERSQPKGVKSKMKGRKLRSGVNLYWQGSLK
jgi:hypothetical protein